MDQELILLCCLTVNTEALVPFFGERLNNLHFMSKSEASIHKQSDTFHVGSQYLILNCND